MLALVNLTFYVIARINFYKWYLGQCLNARSKFISTTVHVVSVTEDIFLEGYFGFSSASATQSSTHSPLKPSSFKVNDPGYLEQRHV